MDFTTINKYFSIAQKKYQQEKDTGAISNCTYFKKNLIVSRLMAQHTIDQYNMTCDEYNRLRRMKQRFQHQGVIINTLNTQIAALSEKCEKIQSLIASLGGVICASLDGWQYYGASYEDLFNFCCCSEKTIADMKESIRMGTTLFSDLVCIHYPDDKSKEEFIDISKYAPMTHAVKEYMCEQLENACKNNNVREKVNNKLFELFPEIKECCLIESVDDFGDTVYTDLDGNIINMD